MDLDFQWMWWMCMWGYGNGSARSWQSKLQKPWGLPSVLTSVITSDDTTPYHRSHGYRRRARAADQPYRRVQRPAQHTGTSIYVYLRLSTSIYVYLRLSTSIYVYLRLSTSTPTTPTLRLRYAYALHVPLPSPSPTTCSPPRLARFARASGPAY
jgi:hypothetical protein